MSANPAKAAVVMLGFANATSTPAVHKQIHKKPAPVCRRREQANGSFIPVSEEKK